MARRAYTVHFQASAPRSILAADECLLLVHSLDGVLRVYDGSYARIEGQQILGSIKATETWRPDRRAERGGARR